MKQNFLSKLSKRAAWSISPFPIMALGLVLGLLSSRALFGLGTGQGLWILSALSLFSFGAAWKWPQFRYCLFAFTFFWGGMAWLQRPLETLPFDGKVHVLFEISNSFEPTHWGGRVGARILAIEQKGKQKWLDHPIPIQIQWSSHRVPAPQFLIGDQWKADLDLQSPSAPLYPKAHDSRIHLRAHGFWGKARALSPWTPVQVQKRSLWTSFRRILERHRQSLVQIFPHSILPAIGLGYAQEVPSEVREAFALSGLSHILAVSGLHFGLVALLTFWIFQHLARLSPYLLKHWGDDRFAALMSLPLLTLYLFYVGAPISAQRAWIMMFIILAGKMSFRESHPLISLSITALFLLILNPFSLWTIGFQLSFMAVLGILAGMHRFAVPTFSALQSFPKLKLIYTYLFQTLWTTLSATLATSPLVLWHFGRLPLLGLLANLWAIPWMSMVLLPLTLLTLMAPSFLQGFLLKLSLSAEALLVHSVQIWNDLPIPISIDWPIREVLTLLLLSATLWSLLSKSRWIRMAFWIFLPLSIFQLYRETCPPVYGELHVNFIPVGQGDATLIEAPNGQSILVDGGGSRNPGKRVIIPTLLGLGWHHIDIVVLTHPDLDHYLGLPQVIRQFHPKEVWTNHQQGKGKVYREMLKAIREVHALHREIDSRQPPLNLGLQTRLAVLWPPPPSENPLKSKNNHSIVLRIDCQKVSFLLTGDLEKPGEQILLHKHYPLVATVLKAGHHGSNTSSSMAFLQRVRPKYAVYSVGAHNRFGFPSLKTQARFRALHVQAFRTDRDGLIQMKTQGQRLEIRQWSPP